MIKRVRLLSVSGYYPVDYYPVASGISGKAASGTSLSHHLMVYHDFILVSYTQTLHIQFKSQHCDFDQSILINFKFLSVNLICFVV
jgi:hypothetical protein